MYIWCWTMENEIESILEKSQSSQMGTLDCIKIVLVYTVNWELIVWSLAGSVGWRCCHSSANMRRFMQNSSNVCKLEILFIAAQCTSCTLHQLWTVDAAQNMRAILRTAYIPIAWNLIYLARMDSCWNMRVILRTVYLSPLTGETVIWQGAFSLNLTEEI